jgi:thymidylate synthase
MDSQNTEEQAYLDLLNLILETGFDKPNRTGTDSRSLTGTQLKFTLSIPSDIEAGQPKMIIPLLTTKNTSFRLILTELLWFLEGECNAQVLATKYNNHIWDANGSREFLDKMGFKERSVGDLGKVYGVQWRHWNQNKPFSDGIDQIAQVIESIKRDPYGRRHIVSAWNPEQIPDMALPACHMLFQFVVRPFGNSDRRPFWLDCVLTQRSADMPLGVPFNIASYATLTHMIASLTNLHGGTLTINMGDCHIYHNQFDGVRLQLERIPKPFPELRFKRVVQNIDDFKVDDFAIIGYDPAPAIKFPFSA